MLVIAEGVLAKCRWVNVPIQLLTLFRNRDQNALDLAVFTIK